nr:hypothetical protein Iba_scaffold45810CG0010 [Ipomoea batatas]GMD76532.1 hypothetical protein Iba_chr13bCG11110 [Ipomoea batatas]
MCLLFTSYDFLLFSEVHHLGGLALGLTFKHLELDHLQLLASLCTIRLLLMHGVLWLLQILDQYLMLASMVLEISFLLDQMMCKCHLHWGGVVTIHFQFLLLHNRVAMGAVEMVHIWDFLFHLLCHNRVLTSHWCKTIQLARKFLRCRSHFHHHNTCLLPCNYSNQCQHPSLKRKILLLCSGSFIKFRCPNLLVKVQLVRQ